MEAIWTRARRLAASVYRAASDDALSLMAGGIAFSAVLSLVPMIVIIVAVAGAIWSQEDARRSVLSSLSTWAGQDVVGPIREAFDQWALDAHQSSLAMFVGVLLLLWSATRLFAQVRAALNRVWQVESPGRTIAFRGRLVGLAIVLCLGLVVGLGLIVRLGLHSAAQWIGLAESWPMRAVDFVASIALLSFALFTVYRVLPDARVHQRAAALGAAATALLMRATTELAGLYTELASPGMYFGAASALVLTILWLHFNALAFLWGAEVTWVLHKRMARPMGTSADCSIAWLRSRSAR